MIVSKTVGGKHRSFFISGFLPKAAPPGVLEKKKGGHGGPPVK
jgi:hypothetical protein